MRPEYLELDGECYVCLPDWMHSALNHGVFDDVVVPPVPLKVTLIALKKNSAQYVDVCKAADDSCKEGTSIWKEKNADGILSI